MKRSDLHTKRYEEGKRAFLELIGQEAGNPFDIIFFNRNVSGIPRVGAKRFKRGEDGLPIFHHALDFESGPLIELVDSGEDDYLPLGRLDGIYYPETPVMKQVFPFLSKGLRNWERRMENQMRMDAGVLERIRQYILRKEKERIVLAEVAWEVCIPSRGFRSECLFVYLPGLGNISFERALESSGIAKETIVEVGNIISSVSIDHHEMVKKRIEDMTGKIIFFRCLEPY
ncbi:MAG: hypothetical protein WCJ25_00950 [Candidatus Moraniibacteriota bacterium]